MELDGTLSRIGPDLQPVAAVITEQGRYAHW